MDNLNKGCVKDCTSDLVQLQTLIQTLVKSEDPNVFVILSSTESGSALIRLPEEMKSQIHALTYFVSGLVYRMDDTNKAKAFFSEGIKLCNGNNKFL